MSAPIQHVSGYNIGTRATLQGTPSGDHSFLCPTRLIMRGTLVVSSWKPARGAKCTP